MRVPYLLVLVLLSAPSVATAQLVFDNGVQNLLDTLDPGFDPTTTPIEVRDSVAGDPTALDVDLGMDLADRITFTVHGDSGLALVSLGYAAIQTFDDSDATIEAGSLDCCPGNNDPFDAVSFAARDRSHLFVNDDALGGTARNDSTVTFGPDFGVLATFFHGMDNSNTLMLGGGMPTTFLSGNATMTVRGGSAGFDSVEVRDSARLVIDGGTALGSHGILVEGHGRIDFHSGRLNSTDPIASAIGAREFGIVRVFGTDFLLDGVPTGPGRITAPAGQAREGIVSGIFESGQAFTVPFGVLDSAAIQLVPEPETQAPLALALLLAIQLSGRGSAKA